MSAVNLSITPGDVAVEDGGTIVKSVQFGSAVTAGEPVYRSSSDGKYRPGDASAASTARVIGIVYEAADADAYGFIVTNGSMDVGATLVPGRAYAVSDTAGKICAMDSNYEAESGIFITTLGVAVATDQLDVRIQAYGSAIPE
tara:strand:- start:1152 stop:1580 length:429 start_codon:yes stop_codon:yes gene_type:complete